jgi:RimJ/RimL family protein N-acetyltransferase
VEERVTRTPRLSLRQWRDDDLEPFAALNRDPEVMRYFPALMSRADSDALVEQQQALLQERGWGLWAVEVIGGAPFVGFVGLNVPRFEAHFTPAVEVGWRLAREHWGCGYATEAARAAVCIGFERLDLDEIVSFTVPANRPSRRVMERLGMTHAAAADFDHPHLPPDSPLRRHVLYRLTREQWLEQWPEQSPVPP